MSTESQQLETIRGLVLSLLEQVSDDPATNYPLDGQVVSWADYVDSLKQTIDWCDRKLNEYQPYEHRSEATS